MTAAGTAEPENPDETPDPAPPPPDEPAGSQPPATPPPGEDPGPDPDLDDRSVRSAAAADYGSYTDDGAGVTIVGSVVYAGQIAGRDAGHRRGGGSGKPETERVPVALVPADELAKLQEVTIPSDQHASAAEALGREGLMFVAGPPGSGKRAGGIALFGETEAVLEIDPTVGPDALLSFTEQIRQDGIACYLIDSLAAETTRALSGFTVRALAAQVRQASARLVVTLDSRIPVDPGVALHSVRWTSRPDSLRVLRKHLTHYLGVVEAESVLAALPTDDLRDQLDARGLRTIDQVAKAVARAHRSGADVGAAVHALGFDARRQIEEWFAPTTEPESPGAGRTTSEIAWLVVCAVLGGCSYRTVARHAKTLTALLNDLAGLEPEAGRPALLQTRSTRLKDVQATLDTGFLQTEFGTSVTETVAPSSGPRMRAVLDVIWHEYELIAEGMLRWLLEAGTDQQSAVRTKAAFAAGYLAEHDFAEIRSRLILPWAKQSTLTGRTAAYALGVPAASDGSRPLVLALLRHWASVSHEGMAWAAVEAYGTFVGLAVPQVAMFELLAVADRGQAPPERIALSARSLFMLGIARSSAVPQTVLAGLVAWLSAKTAVGDELARQTFLGLWSTASDQHRWDAAAVWTALTAENAAPYTAALLARCLDRMSSQRATGAGLRGLVRASHTSPEVLGQLEQLLVASLDHTRGPKEEAAGRIRHYLEGCRATEPRLGITVDALLRALEKKES